MNIGRWRCTKRAFCAAVVFGTALAGCGEAPTAEYDFTGRVTKIVDGDTFYMTDQPVRIRIWGLAAPERDEAGGTAATRALTALIEGQALGCKQHDTDRYGRPVAQCFLSDGLDIAAEMIADGSASEYCRYSRGAYGQCDKEKVEGG